jgi:hypothetical protein
MLAVAEELAPVSMMAVAEELAPVSMSAVAKRLAWKVRRSAPPLPGMVQPALQQRRRVREAERRVMAQPMPHHRSLPASPAAESVQGEHLWPESAHSPATPQRSAAPRRLWLCRSRHTAWEKAESSSPVAPSASDQPEQKEQTEMMHVMTQRRQVAGEATQPLAARGEQQRMMATKRTMGWQRRVAEAV